MNPQPELVLIAAVARNRVIGRDNGLVFYEPADQRHFRAATLGHAVVMGRKTWESLPQRFRPLPGRRNLIISRNAGFSAPGGEVLGSLQAALQSLAQEAKVFIIGGGEIYGQALPLATELLLTEIDAELEGDRLFPEWDADQFELVSATPARTADGIDFRFARYRRRPVTAPGSSEG
ncbi:MAG TPA: dihydrofolate reductase [Rubrivivax sp.]|nr:dihydrofolate reductase [Rubrivivax sp.]